MSNLFNRTAAAALALALGSAGLSGCTSSGVPVNRSLDSVHQPVVQRTNYTMDLTASGGGLAPSEQRRLSGWFEALDLRYGDKITIDDPTSSSANRASVEAVVARYGMLLAGEAPATPGYVNPGTVRVVVSRSTASVRGCPDWGTKSDTNMHNATASGYGCAINGNLAAMVANPEDLIKGSTNAGGTTVMSSNKAIDTYREAKPTGNGGTTVKQQSSKEGN
ncbi:CpaD family pilus assembly protein [Novosphingobium sp. TH158]|uniref:CpaD family pilus assembly protein n=1 Tax=Novosphingobium sp. TH158 TaxID=2067455 RepID=UPI000C7B7607|nr:CpaD family pilus assembly protein [Novosphingobium sp. TH158]PLK24378.1 pilus assembly protein CpaD [Novosphingobium sp. TH158]